MEHSGIEWPPMGLEPIGRVKSDIQMLQPLPGQSEDELQNDLKKIQEYNLQVRNNVCELVIFPRWSELLEGIDAFSHLLVLYWPHLIDPERRKLRKLHPMGRKDLPAQGIFATCSPARPNPVLVSAVRLNERHHNVLRVRGLEAVDGSPIIDVKPYVQPYYGAENPRIPEWMAQIHRELKIHSREFRSFSRSGPS